MSDKDWADREAREIALDIYKTVVLSSRNDRFEQSRIAVFVEKVAPIIAAALRSAAEDARKQEREECAQVAEDWRPERGEHWVNADSLISRAIRARSGGAP